MTKKTWVKHLKNSVVPHHKNKYRPHVIRHYGLAVMLALFLLIQVSYNYTATGQLHVLGFATNVTHAGLLQSTNQHRESNGQNGYNLNSQLSTAAQAKAEHMVENDYWDHYAPDGTTPWSFINNTGYSYLKAGENLAYGFLDSPGVVTGWMNSPPHAANILDAEFTEVGFGFANGDDFQGDENTIVVAMYGLPVSAPAPVESAQTTPPVESTVAEEPAPVEPAPQAEEEPAQPREDESQPAWTPQDIIRSGANAELSVTGDTIISDTKSETSMISAILGGSAHWGIYATVFLVGLLTAVYVSRHSVAVYQFATRGEHFLEGHPLLEASLIYILLWFILFSTYGAIG